MNIERNRQSDRSLHLDATELVDFSLLVLLSLLAAAFTLGSFQVSSDPFENMNGFYLNGSYFYYLPNKMTDLFIFIPASIVYLIVALLFIYRRYKKTNKLPTKNLIMVLGVLVLLRLISAFSFPYGEQSYSYLSPFNNQLYDVSYQGYLIGERIVSFLDEILFYSFFFIAIDYLPTFSSSINKVVNVLLYLIIGIAFIMTIYAFAVSSAAINNNFRFIFIDSTLQLDYSITSFTSQRNVFGFFLLMGAIASFLLSFRKKPNPLLFFFSFYFSFFCLLAWSRIASVLSLVLLILLHLGVLLFTKYKGYRIYSLVVLAVGLFITVLFLTALKETDIAVSFMHALERFKDDGTLEARYGLWQKALSMFNNPYAIIFGYGRIPYISILDSYSVLINSQVLWTSHNAFIDQLLSYGLSGIVFEVAFLGYLIYRFSLLVKNRSKIGLTYLVILILLLVYSNYEPRMLLSMEGTEIMLFYVFLLTFLFDSKNYSY